MAAADRVFWEHRGHPGAVVVPFLLIGGSGAAADARWTDLLLFDLLDQANSIDFSWVAAGLRVGRAEFDGTVGVPN